MEVKQHYYPIDEDLAKEAKAMMSFESYEKGSLTAEYKAKVNEAYELANRLADVRPEEADHGYWLADQYARKLADNFNDNSRIGTMCPSVMISGAGNFPVKKKQRQIEAWDRNFSERDDLEKIKGKIISLINGKNIIKSKDENVITKLEDKIAKLEQKQKTMKEVNSWYRKHHYLRGCPSLSVEEIEKLEEDMKKDWRIEKDKPYQTFELTNNNQMIRAAKARLEKIKAEKSESHEDIVAPDGLYRLVENTEIMRLQFIFAGKPEESVRAVLKKNGFKWSPKQGRWQRPLTDNAKRAAKKVMEELNELNHE